MGLLQRLLGREEKQSTAEAEASEPVCPHVALVPRWDSADDMGNPDKVSFYVCEACQAPVSREEGERLQAAAAERVALPEADRPDEE